MSADLFAAFGDEPPAPSSQQPQSKPGLATTDAFDFPAFNSAAFQAQNNQPAPQWPSIQQSTPAQTNPLVAAQVGQPAPPNSVWGDFSSLGGTASFGVPFPATQNQPRVEATEEDDGWGDFEVASPVAAPNPPAPAPVPASAQLPRPRVARASTIDLLSNKLVDVGPLPSKEPWQQRPSWEKSTPQEPRRPQPATNSNPNVLFDADDFDGQDIEEEDEFGEFETEVSLPPKPAPAPSSLDLLSLDSMPTAPAQPKKQPPPGLILAGAVANTANYPQAPKSPYGSFQERKPDLMKQLQVTPPLHSKMPKDPSEASPSPVTAWPELEAGSPGAGWVELEKEMPSTKPSKAAVNARSQPKSKLGQAAAPAPDWDWQDWDGGNEDQPANAPKNQKTKAAAKPATAVIAGSTPPAPISPSDVPAGPPPTNVPPPAILLSLFPELLDFATPSLRPLTTLPSTSSAYQRVLADSATLTFIRGYLALATVAARLIAGRKHRWHRDKFLAQGMSISAAGGKNTGMKLAGVDRTQAAREDQEAAEVVEVWKKQVGKLRSIVAGANAAHQETLKVPEVALAMPVSTAKGVPTAPKACVICGLKRDERVTKVDFAVEDSFGEWWVEFWGHRACRNFWVEHERELRQR